MLTLIGDILNWAAAGLVFPLMILPLAGLVAGGRAGALVWLALVLLTVGAGFAFAALAPRLFVGPGSLAHLPIFAGMALALAVGIAILGGARKTSERLAGPVAWAVRATGRAVMWLLLVMALAQVAAVALRYVFGINFIFVQESVTYMHAAVFLLAAGYALLTDDHVRVDIFYRSAPPRTKALIDFAGVYLFLFPVCLLILWTAAPYVGRSWAVREGSAEQSGVQAVFVLKSFIPAFALLVSMAGFAIAARAGRVLREEKG